jgi:hypothetical protein
MGIDKNFCQTRYVGRLCTCVMKNNDRQPAHYILVVCIKEKRNRITPAPANVFTNGIQLNDTKYTGKKENKAICTPFHYLTPR